MPGKKRMIVSVAAFCGGVLSLLLFVTAEPWPWVGMGGALIAVILGRLAKPQTKAQQALALGGILLALASGVGYIVLFWR